MLKRVIFVGGTSYSGSTMLDMMLSNDPAGFSCGEIVNLFRPTKPHHVNPSCGCGDAACTVWCKVHRAGPQRLYASISKLFPDVSFVVDSSKNVCWIAQQEKIARAQGLDVSHVLIWKSPTGLFRSFSKRSKASRFASVYCDYHRFYNSLVPNWTGVQYESLIDGPLILGLLCDQLGIPMFDDKHQFWQRRHHTLFGNNSAKVSLYARGHPKFELIKHARIRIEGEDTAPVAEHRSVYRENKFSSPHAVERQEAYWKDLERVASGLLARSIKSPDGAAETRDFEVEMPRASGLECAMRCATDALRRLIAQLRYRQRFP